MISKQGIFYLFLLFSLCLGLGILVSLRLDKVLGSEVQAMSPISIQQFLLNFAFAIGFIFVAIFLGRRFKNQKKYLFKALFLLSIGLGGFICLGVFIGDLAIPPIVILILLWLKKPNVLLQNILVVLGIAGAGSLLGTKMAPQTIVLLLIVFSIYDYIAVFKTKHMQKMAKEMMEQQAILGLILPQSISGFSAALKKIKPGDQKFFILGGGDIVFPLMFCVSLLKTGIMPGLIVAGFSMIGLGANFYFLNKQKQRKPIPALPLIALFSIIGYLITRLF